MSEHVQATKENVVKILFIRYIALHIFLSIPTNEYLYRITLVDLSKVVLEPLVVEHLVVLELTSKQ